MIHTVPFRVAAFVDMSSVDPRPGGVAPYKVLMAPMNFADQPMSLVRALRRRGVDAHHLQYSATGEHPLGYRLDRVASIGMSDYRAQLGVVADCLREGFDVFHFWQRSLLFGRHLDSISGFDVPLFKAQGARLFHRFTGFDLRLPSADRALNPHSPYHHGFESPFDERAQRDYIAMLREYVDVFFVQDPELGQFMPEARVLPRGLELEAWEFVGVEPTARPLIVHAPSKAAVKGSRYIVSALEDLAREGLAFDFKLLERVPHAEARAWYQRADIIVDQILIGATGVLTLEAWALGKPCVTYLRCDLFEPFYATHELPVANATPDTIKHTLRRLIGDFEWRRELSRRGRELIERFHDIDRVAADYDAICRAALAGGQSTRPASATAAFFPPRLRAELEPLLPLPGLAADPRAATRRIADIEAILYRTELMLMRLALRAQAFAFKALALVIHRMAALGGRHTRV